VPADERLREPDFLDQIGDGGVAVREAFDDAEPIDVGQRLMNDAQLPQLIGLVDNGSNGRANTGGGGGQEEGLPEGRRVASTTIYINGS
jgi:hypothetical protein